MQAKKTVTINGRLYDAVTGLPVKEAKVTETGKKKPSTTTRSNTQQSVAAAVHKKQQRSQTLQRRIVKKPSSPKKTAQSTAGKHMDIARSPKISRFAPHPQTKPKKPAQATPDKKPVSHPLTQKALKKPTGAARPASAKETKDRAVAAALASKPTAQKKPKKERVKKQLDKKWRRVAYGVSILVVALIGAAVLYFTIPNIAVSFAGQQAGVEASYPSYTPDGYRFKQPVQFSEGKVELDFVSKSGPTTYTITQAKSSWDSSAVLDNVIKPEVGDNYTTVTERGLTIYSSDKLTTWVNGGIHYIIEGDAILTPEQKRSIANSL